LFGFCGVSFWSVLEEAALVFGLAHLRFTQNVARPNTSTTSSSTTFLVLAPPLATTLFSGWWRGMGCKRSSESSEDERHPIPRRRPEKSERKKTALYKQNGFLEPEQ